MGSWWLMVSGCSFWFFWFFSMNENYSNTWYVSVWVLPARPGNLSQLWALGKGRRQCSSCLNDTMSTWFQKWGPLAFSSRLLPSHQPVVWKHHYALIYYSVERYTLFFSKLTEKSTEKKNSKSNSMSKVIFWLFNPQFLAIIQCNLKQS